MTTAADILEVLASLGHKSDPEARTAAELAEAWGKNVKWVREAIGALSRLGHVRVTNKITTTISGHPTTVPAYIVSVPMNQKKGSSNGPRNARSQRRK